MQQDDGSTTEAALTVMNRTMLEMGLQLYTSDYGKTVGNETPAYAVVLTVTQGKFALGETTVCKVESINKNQKNIPLEKDKIVLCTPVNYLNDEDMANIGSIFVGQRIDFTIKPQDTAWSDVYEAISGPNSIVSANTVTDKTAAIPENYPSSIIGVTADGGYIMTQIDGRNMGGSFGIGPIEAGGYMKSLGCTDSLLFDGGGSSEMVIKSDGKFVVCNKPSDGTERKVGTCLLIVKKTDVYSTPYKAAIAPAYEASFMHKFFPFLAAASIIVPIALIAVIVVLIIKHNGKKKAEKALDEDKTDKKETADKTDNIDNTDNNDNTDSKE